MDVTPLKPGFEFITTRNQKFTFSNGNTLELFRFKPDVNQVREYDETVLVEIYNSYTKKQHLFDGVERKEITVNELPSLMILAATVEL